jgi:hypothetical protein
VNDTRGAIRQAQDERAVTVEPVEQAIGRTAVGEPRGERSADRVRALQPAGADGRDALPAPNPQPAGEGVGERFGEVGRVWGCAMRGEAGGATMVAAKALF